MLVPDPANRSAVRWTWLLACSFALAALVLFTRHQDFPYLYHTDEPSKVSQIIRHQYNFHHPLMLLRTTEALVKVTGTALSPQPVVEKGRLASAIFAALSVGAVVLLASRLTGRMAGALAGVLALTHPVLFELSHYMKEDCALLIGIMATVAALAVYGGHPTLWKAFLIGAGCGLALSGKYLGFTVSILAFVSIALTKPPQFSRWTALGLAAFGMFACFAAINYPSLQSLDRVSASVTKEISKVEKRAEERPEPIKFKHLSKLGTTLSIPLLIGIVYWIRRRWRFRNHEPLIWRALGVYLFAYFLLISLVPKTKDRYLLPVYVLACVLGAAGLVEWVRHCRKHRARWTRRIPRIIAVTAIALHLPGLIATFKAFKHDDRRELAEWIKSNVPPEEGIAHDVRALLTRAKGAGLPDFQLPNPLHAPPDRYVADLGSIAELRSRGITHIAVCEADYHNTDKQGSKDEMRARAQWYGELFDSHRLVWQSRVGPVPYLQPGLRLYALEP